MTKICLTLFCLFVALPARAFDRTFTETDLDQLTGIFEVLVPLQPGGTYNFWTENLVNFSGGCGADTVMHVRSEPGSASVINKSNDDCTLGFTSSPGSCISHTNTSSDIIFVRVAVHAFTTCAGSTGTFRASGPGVAANMANRVFGGMQLFSATNNVGWSANDVIHVVRPPNSQSDGFRAYALTWVTCGWNDLHVAGRGTSGNAQGLNLDVGPTASASFCRTSLVFGRAGSLSLPVSARAYVNDGSTADADSDGLGNNLEIALGTCHAQWPPGNPTSQCGFGPNAADTDGDGISDRDELIGTTTQKLPEWGSDPLHKDVFVEFDFQNTLSGNPFSGADGQPGDPINGAAAELITGPFAEAFDTEVANPDGEDGISVHVDIGISSCNPDCDTSWGDWGGSNSTSFGQGQRQQSAMNDMVTARRGIFRHGLIFQGPGGTGGVADWFFEVGQSSSVWLFTHGAAHELGHNLGAEHWGSTTDVNDLICKPNYRSIMSYTIPGGTAANPTLAQYYAFSHGTQPSIRSDALAENADPGLDDTYLEAFFDIDASGLNTIDWNRDGSIGGTVAAPTRWATAIDGCQPGFFHVTEKSFNLDPNRIPAMAQLGTTLHVFFVATSGKLMHSTLSSPIVACTGPNTPTGCCSVTASSVNGCQMSWSTPTEVPVSGTISSSPAAVMIPTQSSGERIALAYSTTTGGVRTMKIRRVVSQGSYGSEASLSLSLLQNPSRNQSDPALVFHPTSTSNSKLVMYYLDPSQAIQRVSFAHDVGNFPHTSPAPLKIAGVTVTSRLGPAATRYASASGPAVALVVYGLTSNNDRLAMLSNDDSSATATDLSSSLAALSPNAIGSRASIIQHFEYGNPGGTLELYYSTSGGNLRRSWTSSGTTFINDRNIYDGAAGRFGAGLAVYKGRVQMATACPGCTFANSMQHLPFATGVFPFVERDNNDFATFAGSMCAGLSAAVSGGTGLCSAPGSSALTMPSHDASCRFQ